MSKLELRQKTNDVTFEDLKIGDLYTRPNDRYCLRMKTEDKKAFVFGECNVVNIHGDFPVIKCEGTLTWETLNG